MAEDRANLYRWASGLALFTIGYNVLEGLVSVFFGLDDETLALVGFGIDSFVEILSGIGVWHMVRRIRESGANGGDPDLFERRALQITGTAFYLLAIGLLITAALNIYARKQPDTTIWGIIVASISIAAMWILIKYKLAVGRRLGSEAILADAGCTKVCLNLSIVLLISSFAYEMTGIGDIDTAGAILISVFAFREGREAFMKSSGKGCSCRCAKDEEG
ncbi:MAG: cation transporter [Deltaproteobacteria bacterium]|nr:cation transporter [Deltaproteobacteria bacterium]